MKTFVTFGFDHQHIIQGEVFDYTCVAVVAGGRDRVFEIFGDKFCFEYPEEYWRDEKMRYFPGGYVEVNP